jgi:hypothetical protein
MCVGTPPRQPTPPLLSGMIYRSNNYRQEMLATKKKAIRIFDKSVIFVVGHESRSVIPFQCLLLQFSVHRKRSEPLNTGRKVADCQLHVIEIHNGGDIFRSCKMRLGDEPTPFPSMISSHRP